MEGLVRELGGLPQNLDRANSRARSQVLALWLPFLLVIGAAKNYRGYFLQRAAIMLIGGVTGAAIGFAMGESSGWPAGFSILFAAVAGCVAGWLAWILKLATAFLIGACLGGIFVVLETQRLGMALIGAIVGGLVLVSFADASLSFRLRAPVPLRSHAAR